MDQIDVFGWLKHWRHGAIAMLMLMTLGIPGGPGIPGTPGALWASSACEIPGQQEQPGDEESPDGCGDDDDDCGEGGGTKPACPAHSSDSTNQPVRYATGRLKLNAVDLPAVSDDSQFRHKRLFHNRMAAPYDGPNGFNWLVAEIPYITKQVSGGTGVLIAYVGNTRPIWADESGGSYTPRNDPRGKYKITSVTLNDGSSSSGIQVAIGVGERTSYIQYYSPDDTTRPGAFFKRVDPYGVTTEVVSYHASRPSQPTEIQRVVTDSGVTTTYSIVYDYFASAHANEFKMQYATLRKKVDAGSWQEIRRVAYVYYGASENHGSINDLKTATQQKPDGSGGWIDVSADYYRYYKDGDTNGSNHLLKYVVGKEGYRRLDAAVADPLAATDTQVATHADYYFEYDSNSMVTKEVASAGCGCGGGDGTQGDTFVRTTSAHADGYNNWKYKTVVTFADGDEERVYTNYLGQPILKVRVEDPAGASPRLWCYFFRYNSAGQIVESAMPSAVTISTLAELTTAESNTDLVDYGNAGNYLADSSGLITVRSFYSTTTATDTTPGGVAGYLQYEAMKQGESGTEIKQVEKQYFKYTINQGQADEETVYPIAKELVYPDASNQTVTYETSYAYTYHSGTLDPASITRTLPVVSTAQNGSGSTTSTVTIYDVYGNRAWFKDERGVISRMVYDIPSGKLIQRITDVDTTQTTDEPSGWTTVASMGFGHHLTTDYDYDDLGRLVRTMGPAHEVDLSGVATTVRSVSWTAYVENAPTAKDEVRSGSGYATGSVGSYSFTLVDPVRIVVQGKSGNWAYEQILAKRTTGSGELTASDTFAQSDYQSWTVNTYHDNGKVATTSVYHTIPSSGAGSSGTNFDETLFAYDPDTNELIKTASPGGTITRAVYDTRGNVIEQWVGTDDTDAIPGDPTGGGATGNNMKRVASYEYDGGNAGGDGNLTSITQHVDDTTTRVTSYAYDWRNRRVAEDGEVDAYVAYTHDNLGRVTKVERYDTSDTGNLIARNETKFDDRGRVYQTITYGVDPATGTVSNSLVSNTWYDAAGNVIKQVRPGQTFTKSTYDALGRVTATYVGYDTTEATSGSYADADDVTGDTILEQSEAVYNDAGQVLTSISYQRLHDDTTTTGSLSAGSARMTYQAFWYDGAGRQFAAADYGTNGGSALSRPSTAPAASDTVLVATTEFDDAGRAHKVTDPSGLMTRTFFDHAGRATYVVENYTSWTGEPSATPPSRSSDANRVTAYTYNADGQVATLVAVDPDADGSAADNQTTTYVYGTTLSESGVASSTLLRAIIYPDSDDPSDLSGTGTDSTYDRVELAYNCQSEVIKRIDQRETTHEYDYDKLGRLLHDRVTSLGRAGEAVDADVRRISRSYEVRGMLQAITSYDNAATGSGSVVNEVKHHYNDFGQLIADYQAHAGSVDDDGANNDDSPAVAYSYENGSDATKQIRFNKLTYPNGREVHALYADAGDTNGLSHHISRVVALATATTRGTSEANVIAAYDHLGMNTTVRKSYPTPAVRLDHFGGTSGTYAGWDRFGRVVSQPWQDYSAGPGNEVDVLHVQHAYDRSSNRLYADRQVYTGESQVYQYDNLHRLTQFKSGYLKIDGSTADTAEQWTRQHRVWNFDALGNPLDIDERGTSDWRVNTFNAANEMVTRQTRGDRPRPETYFTHFDKTAENAYWELPAGSTDAFDIHITDSSDIKITTINQDTYDSIQEPEAAAIVLLDAPATGQVGLGAWFDFHAGVTSGQVGFVFGYQNPNDYWIHVLDQAVTKERVYRIFNGTKTLINEKSADHPHWYNFQSHAGYANDKYTLLAGGFPEGRIGVYANTTEFTMTWMKVITDTEVRDVADRLQMHQTHLGTAYQYPMISPTSDRLHLKVERGVSGDTDQYKPNYFRNIRVDRFQTTFSLRRVTGASWINFAFDGKDVNNFNALRLYHEGYSTPSGRWMVDGQYTDNPSESAWSENKPWSDEADVFWYRITCDGTTVRVHCQESATEPTTWDETNNLIYESSAFDIKGGMIGFMAQRRYGLQVDDVTIKSDRDGNGTYETIEHVEDFTLDASSYASETLTYDGAGNLTYDGIYQYRYDAWNRLVAVTKAYRSPSGTGSITLGSEVMAASYDGMGRRTIKEVKNSADLNATYHYYYQGQSIIEERNGSDMVLRQYVWGNLAGGYVDELVQMAINDDPADGTEQDCDRIYYAMQDANFNVLGVVDETGTLVERYEYSPYGQRTVYFSVGSNDTKLMTPTQMSRRVTYEVDDGNGGTITLHHPYGLNPIGHQGLMHDEELGLQIHRPRPYDLRTGRFLNRSHWGYIQNRLSLYDYEIRNPIKYVEPFSAAIAGGATGTVVIAGGGGGAIAGSIGGGGSIAAGGGSAIAGSIGGTAAGGAAVGVGTAVGAGVAAAAVGGATGYAIGTGAAYIYQESGLETSLVNGLSGGPRPPSKELEKAMFEAAENLASEIPGAYSDTRPRKGFWACRANCGTNVTNIESAKEKKCGCPEGNSPWVIGIGRTRANAAHRARRLAEDTAHAWVVAEGYDPATCRPKHCHAKLCWRM